jgi:translation initiation factor IF-3
MNQNYKNFKKKEQEKHRINGFITSTEIRLVGDNIHQGVYSIREALRMANEQHLDLVEISPNANPPVCKIVDYQKFLYDQKKKEKENAQKQKLSNKELKEIRFTANTDDNDIEVKKRKIIEFLEKGHKVKALVIFKGREIQHKDRGEILLLNLANDIQEFGKVEGLPKLDGKNMHMMISPKK